jgi:hypothetical protein
MPNIFHIVRQFSDVIKKIIFIPLYDFETRKSPYSLLLQYL